MLLITVIGALGALAVLLFVYASGVAIVPLLIAIPSILTTFLLVLGLEQAISVNFLVEYLVAVMGLGVAVDYSLLLITRWREERDAGRSNEEAILAAGPTAGRAVVLSGATVAVGLLSLVVLPVPFLRSIGLGWHADPARRDHRRRHAAAGDPRRVGPSARQAPRAPELDHLQPPVGAWAKLIVRRRWVAGAVGLAIVIGLALPALTMNTGQPRANSLGGNGQPARTLHALERQGVPSAVVFPIQVLAHGGPAAARARESDRERDTGHLRRAGSGHLRVPAWQRLAAERDPDRRGQHLRRNRNGDPSARGAVERARSRRGRWKHRPERRLQPAPSTATSH